MEIKKEISIDKEDLYLIKVVCVLLLIMVPFVIYSLVLETDNKYEKLMYIVIYLSACLYAFRFVWFAKHVRIDESHFLISGLFKKYSLPIETVVKVEHTFLMWFQQFPQIKLRFRLPGEGNRLVILIPNSKASKTEHIVDELKEIIESAQVKRNQESHKEPRTGGQG